MSFYFFFLLSDLIQPPFFLPLFFFHFLSVPLTSEPKNDGVVVLAATFVGVRVVYLVQKLTHGTANDQIFPLQDSTKLGVNDDVGRLEKTRWFPKGAGKNVYGFIDLRFVDLGRGIKLACIRSVLIGEPLDSSKDAADGPRDIPSNT